MILCVLPAGLGATRYLSEAERPATATRVAYVVGHLAEEELLAFLATASAMDPTRVVLLDTPAAAPYLKDFLKEYRPERVVAVGSFTDTPADRDRRLGVTLMEPANGKAAPPGSAGQVVVCPAQPRRVLLHAACLAGAVRAPLIVTRGDENEAKDLVHQLTQWKARQVFAGGGAAKLLHGNADFKVVELTDEGEVASAAREWQLRRGKFKALLVANPADTERGSGLSSLAPGLAVQRQAALLLTNEAGDNTAALVDSILQDRDIRPADALVLLGDLKAIPMERRPNPVAGKDAEIEMEPLTPTGDGPFSFATGRLFHRDRGIVALTLARQRLLAHSREPRKALIASNPGGSLPLMEIFSRHTALELGNRGYQTTALFDHQVNKRDLRRLLPEQDIFLWEGHYKTMVEDYQVPAWTERLRPSLMFLQSCLALNETEAQPFVERGAVALVGSSTRIYSATGGAFTLAFFDALLYDEQSLGGALRQAKNFLLVYSILKQKRLGGNSKLSGANLRSAWAFTLWGDPLLRLPAPAPPQDGLSAAGHEVRGDTIILARPRATYRRVTTEEYTAHAWPNARLAGLVTKNEGNGRQLVPLLFAEVRLRPPTPASRPRLHSKIGDDRWAFVWDGRRETGYLLVVPPRRGEGDIRFEVRWQ